MNTWLARGADRVLAAMAVAAPLDSTELLDCYYADAILAIFVERSQGAGPSPSSTEREAKRLGAAAAPDIGRFMALSRIDSGEG